jgi:hypothetical protein
MSVSRSIHLYIITLHQPPDVTISKPTTNISQSPCRYGYRVSVYCSYAPSTSDFQFSHSIIDHANVCPLRPQPSNSCVIYISADCCIRRCLCESEGPFLLQHVKVWGNHTVVDLDGEGGWPSDGLYPTHRLCVDALASCVSCLAFLSHRCFTHYLYRPCLTSAISLYCSTSHYSVYWMQRHKGLAAAWAGMLVFDSLVFSMTVYKSLLLRQTSGMNLLTLMLRDGKLLYSWDRCINNTEIEVRLNIFWVSLTCFLVILSLK